MNDNDIKRIEAQGWVVECESPLEIRHSDGSFATRNAARTIVDSILSEGAEESTLLDHLAARPLGIDESTLLADLLECIKYVARRVSCTQASISAQGDDDAGKRDMAWSETYDQVFSKSCSQRIFSLFDALSMRFEWCDPDASYEDDVLAFHRALEEAIPRIHARAAAG